MPARESKIGGLTRIERERRAEIIAATITLVAEHGHAAASLSRIAQAAGVAKGTVVYHFTTKDAVLAEAYQHVLSLLVTHVAAQVEAAPPQEAPAAYVRAMVGYLADRPEHARTIVQASLAGAAADEPGARPAGHERWGPLAAILARAAEADDRPADEDQLRTLAILTGGMIDAVVAELLEDPGYDSLAAAEQIVSMLYRSAPGADQDGTTSGTSDTAAARSTRARGEPGR